MGGVCVLVVGMRFFGGLHGISMRAPDYTYT